MQTQSIGRSDLKATTLAYGCMRIAGTWNPAEITPAKEAAGKAAVIAAFENGYKLFDHADIYCRGECERIFGQVLREVPELKRVALIATKCGVRFPGEPLPDSPHRYDFSYEHIVASCEASLDRLGVECVDLYQLHRPDYLMNPEEVARAFDHLFAQGKVKWFGVSNFAPSKLAALQASLSRPLIVNQVEVHLGRLDCLHDGTLDQCLERGITPLAWSPLGGGSLGDGAAPGGEHQKLLETMDAIARAHEVSRTIVALGWLLKHPSRIIPIVGSVRPDKIREATRVWDFELAREDWYRLLAAAQGHGLA